MRENFSKGIRKILKLAKEEAVRLAHSYVGSEHLLLGIIKDKGGSASVILKSIGANIEEIKFSDLCSRNDFINMSLSEDYIYICTKPHN